MDIYFHLSFYNFGVELLDYIATLEKLPAISQSGGTTAHSFQPCIKDPFSALLLSLVTSHAGHLKYATQNF